MKIKACPFCGNNEDDKIYIVSEDEGRCSLGYFYIECGGCDACGSIRETEEEAVKYWNNNMRQL